MDWNRRQVMGIAAGLWATAWSHRLLGSENLPSPEFAYPEEKLRFRGGLRPFRHGSYRLETEPLFNDKLLVHNYGHGGSGITMSWGCALEVVDLVQAWVGQRPSAKKPPVAILGAGVMGLTAAILLQKEGFPVTVYAKGFYDETTSAVAGGLWAPAYLDHAKSGPGLEQYHRILRRALSFHRATIGAGLGAEDRDTYSRHRLSALDSLPSDVMPPAEALSRLPFAGFNAPGYRYRSMLIEPLVMLRGLEMRLRMAGASLERRVFHEASELASLPASIVVNCLGLGARELFDDRQMQPIKGQLCLLPAQSRLRYLYTGRGYIFPRSDAVVVGGTAEVGVEDATPERETCLSLLEKARSAFAGQTEDVVGFTEGLASPS